jgi:hypothetical protein
MSCRYAIGTVPSPEDYVADNDRGTHNGSYGSELGAQHRRRELDIAGLHGMLRHFASSNFLVCERGRQVFIVLCERGSVLLGWH